MTDILTIIGILVGLPIAVYEIWLHLLRPHVQRTKLLRFAELVDIWYNHMHDASVEGQKPEYNGEFVRLERKIDNFAEDYGISGFTFRIRPAFMREYMVSCGVDEPKASEPTAFESRSHCPPRDFTVNDLWGWQKVDGYLWRSGKGTGDPLLALTMRMKLLKMYLKIKET